MSRSSGGGEALNCKPLLTDESKPLKVKKVEPAQVDVRVNLVLNLTFPFVLYKKSCFFKIEKLDY